MNLTQLYRSYEFLTDKADQAFSKIKKDHGICIKCERHCSDCCHAVFGLFLIEAVYLKQRFDELGGDVVKKALLRVNAAERALKRLEIKLSKYEDDPEMQSCIMAQERVPCPLLDENQDCILYPHRPITCRVYGIPTKIQGKARTCSQAEFENGKSYPVFDLDAVYRNLYELSTDLLKEAEKGDPQKASYLISVARAISTPIETVISEGFS